VRLSKNHSATEPLGFPGEKPGPSFPLHEPVTGGKPLQSVEKFEASEAWTPAFAGTARVEVANFSSRSGHLPRLWAFPPHALYLAAKTRGRPDKAGWGRRLADKLVVHGVGREVGAIGPAHRAELVHSHLTE
jgi:hypothetical protein